MVSIYTYLIESIKSRKYKVQVVLRHVLKKNPIKKYTFFEINVIFF